MFYMYTLGLRSCQAMFLQKAALQRSSVELAVSYMEIYKDEVYDLFVNRESVRYLSVELDGCFSMTFDSATSMLNHFHGFMIPSGMLNTRYRHPSFLSVKTMSGKYSSPT